MSYLQFRKYYWTCLTVLLTLLKTKEYRVITWFIKIFSKRKTISISPPDLYFLYNIHIYIYIDSFIDTHTTATTFCRPLPLMVRCWLIQLYNCTWNIHFSMLLVKKIGSLPTYYLFYLFVWWTYRWKDLTLYKITLPWLRTYS